MKSIYYAKQKEWIHEDLVQLFAQDFFDFDLLSVTWWFFCCSQDSNNVDVYFSTSMVAFLWNLIHLDGNNFWR